MSHMRHNNNKSGDPRRSPVAAKSGNNKYTKTPSSKGKNPASKSSTGKTVSNGVHEVKGSPVGNGFAASLPNRKTASSAKEEEEIVKMNLLTLQKMDKSVSSILETVPHVVLYEFKTSDNVWERTSSEGTLFVYNRSGGSTRTGFLILNRLNSDNIKEEIVPGMEFRFQPPFILYGKESGSIFGLCIQDQQLCSKTRELLNRLSGEASSGSDTSESPSSSSSPPTQGRHSVSPAAGFGEGPHPHPHPNPHPNQQRQEAHFMEQLENAGCGYLGGQCFSDDTDSHDETHPSPPKRGVAHKIASSALCGQDSMSAKGFVSRGVEVQLSLPGLPSGGTHSPNLSSANTHSQRTIPREIPNVPQKEGVSCDQYQSPQQKAVPGTAQNMQQKRPPTDSPNPRQDHTPTAGPNSSPCVKQRGVVQHAASFDQVGGSIRGNSSRTEEPTHHHHHGARSHSLFSSPYDAISNSRQYHSAQVPSRAYTATGTSADSSIVRKLFGVSEEPPTTSSPASSSTVGVSLSLQTLFSSQVVATPNAGMMHQSFSTGSLLGKPTQHNSNAAATTTTTAMALPALVSAVSVDEIEKRLTEEAQSPGVGVASLSLSSGQVLLQPSAFVAPPQQPPLATFVVGPPTEDPPPPKTSSPFQAFPSNPPLMPSAGMTAPPLHPSPSVSRASESSAKTPRIAVTTESSNHVSRSSTSHLSPNKVVATTTPTTAKTHKAAAVVDTPPRSSKSLPREYSSVIPGRSLTEPQSALMSPQQFSQSRDESKVGVATTGKPKRTTDIGLTKEQMQEALVYMVQNDHGFIDKLHDAYKLSLTKRLA